MSRSTLSPLGLLFGILGIGTLIYAVLTMTPKLTVTSVPSTDPSAAFGMMFNLKNNGVAAIHEVSSEICVNSSTGPARKEPEGGGVENFGNTTARVGLTDLALGDSVALPFQNLTPGPPGSKIDLVFVIRYEPGWWFWHNEKRFRFSRTETKEKTWIWNVMPLGGRCD